MTDIEKDFVENYNDYLQPIPQEILETVKSKITTIEFLEFLANVKAESLKEMLHLYRFWSEQSGIDYDIKRDTIQRYVNYLKVLIKTEGFKTSYC